MRSDKVTFDFLFVNIVVVVVKANAREEIRCLLVWIYKESVNGTTSSKRPSSERTFKQDFLDLGTPEGLESPLRTNVYFDDDRLRNIRGSAY